MKQILCTELALMKTFYREKPIITNNSTQLSCELIAMNA